MNTVIWIILALIVAAGVYTFIKWNRRPVHWEPEEVAKLIDSWLNDNIDYAGWDYFESCEIRNQKLEEIRIQAIEATWVKSPYIVSCGKPDERLNAEGKQIFEQLKAKCLAL